MMIRFWSVYMRQVWYLHALSTTQFYRKQLFYTTFNTIPLTHWPLGDFRKKIRKVIFQLILMIDGWNISCKIVLKWMPVDLTDGKSTLVQVMAWCRQATSHYLGQCWPGSHGVIRPRWVKPMLEKARKRKTTNRYQHDIVGFQQPFSHFLVNFFPKCGHRPSPRFTMFTCMPGQWSIA